MQLEKKGPALYGTAYILRSVEDKIVLTVSGSQSLYTSTNLSLCFTFLLLSLRGREVWRSRNQAICLNRTRWLITFLGGLLLWKLYPRKARGHTRWLEESYIKITEILCVTVLWEVVFHCLAWEKEILTTQATQLGFVLCNKFQIKEFYNKLLNIALMLKVHILESFRLKNNQRN